MADVRVLIEAALSGPAAARRTCCPVHLLPVSHSNGAQCQKGAHLNGPSGNATGNAILQFGLRDSGFLTALQPATPSVPSEEINGVLTSPRLSGRGAGFEGF